MLPDSPRGYRSLTVTLHYIDPFDIALVYVGLGDKAQALEWLQRAHEDHSFELTWIKVDPRLDSLRGEPRFQDLLRRMNLAP